MWGLKVNEFVHESLMAIFCSEEESELPGSQFQDVTTSGPVSGSSRESDQSTPILGSIGQIGQF